MCEAVDVRRLCRRGRDLKARRRLAKSAREALEPGGLRDEQEGAGLGALQRCLGCGRFRSEFWQMFLPEARVQFFRDF